MTLCPVDGKLPMPSSKPSTSAERNERYRAGLKRQLSEIRAELAILRQNVAALAERQSPEQSERPS